MQSILELAKAARQGFNPFDRIPEDKLIQDLEKIPSDDSMINKQKRLMLLTTLFTRALAARDNEKVIRWGTPLFPLVAEISTDPNVTRQIGLETMTACYMATQFAQALEFSKQVLNLIGPPGETTREDAVKAYIMAAKALTKLGDYEKAADSYLNAARLAEEYSNTPAGLFLLLAALIPASQVYLLNHNITLARVVISRIGDKLAGLDSQKIPQGYHWSFWSMRAVTNEMAGYDYDADVVFRAATGMIDWHNYAPEKDPTSLVGRYGYGLYAYLRHDFKKAAAWLNSYMGVFGIPHCTASSEQRLHFSTIAKLAGIASLHIFLDTVEPERFFDGLTGTLGHTSTQLRISTEAYELLSQADNLFSRAFLIKDCAVYSTLVQDLSFYEALTLFLKASDGGVDLDIASIRASLDALADLEKSQETYPAQVECTVSLTNFLAAVDAGLDHVVTDVITPYLPDPGQKPDFVDPGVDAHERAYDRVHLLAHLASFLDRVRLSQAKIES